MVGAARAALTAFDAAKHGVRSELEGLPPGAPAELVAAPGGGKSATLVITTGQFPGFVSVTCSVCDCPAVVSTTCPTNRSPTRLNTPMA